MIIKIEKPVFELTFAEEKIEYTKFSDDTNTFTSRIYRKDAKIASIQSFEFDTIDGSRLSDNIDGPFGLDVDVLTYLYSIIDPSFIKNVPTNIVSVLTDSMFHREDLKAVRDLLVALFKIESELYDIQLDESGKFILDAEGYLDTVCSLALISNGRPSHYAIQVLKNVGDFTVFPLEKDSFGWLIGGVRTKKGIVVFG